MMESPLFEDLPWLRHGFGNKNILLDHYLVSEKIQTIVLQTKQIHGAVVHSLHRDEKKCLKGDAFITDQSGVVCFVRTADCVPILVADPEHHAVAAVHAGWRGTAAEVLQATLQKMQQQWGSRPSVLRVAIGPAIGPCCYQVGRDVQQALEKWCVPDGIKRWRLDLKEANRQSVENFGVPSTQIDILKGCTCCEPEKWSSYRREGNKRGEQVSFIYGVE